MITSLCVQVRQDDGKWLTGTLVGRPNKYNIYTISFGLKGDLELGYVRARARARALSLSLCFCCMCSFTPCVRVFVVFDCASTDYQTRSVEYFQYQLS
jgi:hypothetical protein